MNLFFQPKLTEGVSELEPEESVHVIKVLRHKVGDTIQVTDGVGNLYSCEINKITGKKCSLTIQSKAIVSKPKHYIHVAISPTKSSDRMEWFVEKATEIGIQKISFIRTQHSERNKINLDRIRKVSVSAMKQSGQTWLPEFSEIVEFKKILSADADQKFIAHVDENANHLNQVAGKNKSYLILIGPEGDFTKEEVDSALSYRFQSVKLGLNILRTEKTGVVACHILNLIQNR